MRNAKELFEDNDINMKKNQDVKKGVQMTYQRSFSTENNFAIKRKKHSFSSKAGTIKEFKRKNDNLKVALVHDFLVNWGGAEKVLETLCEMFPEAPIYTLLYDKEKMGKKFGGQKIKTSFLQKFPKIFRTRFRRYLLPLMPVAPEVFDLRDFDLVISSSGAWSKGIVTRLSTIHIAYLHSPMRFVWDYNEKYLRDIGKKIGFCKRMFLTYLRIWDYQATQRPDVLLVNSKYTQKRIKKYYRRDSRIVYPPVVNKNKSGNDIDGEQKKEKYFLMVSRLTGYKKVDLVVNAFNKLELPLIIVGEGEQKKYLQKIAGKTVKVVGWQDEKNLAKYYQGARALIFPAVDDFGMVMVEAMRYGVPIIAIKKGGAKEIVKEGLSGEFFEAQTVEVLADGVRRFIENEKNYDANAIKKEAEKFSQEKFKEKIEEVIKEKTLNAKM